MKRKIGIAFILIMVAGLALETSFLPLSRNLAAVYANILVALTNQSRIEQNGSPLQDNPLLTLAAQNKANDMASKSYFSHISPDGKTPWKWIEEAGYDYIYAGENLAVNFDQSEDVVKAWMNSPTHRANIVNGNFTEIGIATAKGFYKGREAVFVVQMFGAPAK